MNKLFLSISSLLVIFLASCATPPVGNTTLSTGPKADITTKADTQILNTILNNASTSPSPQAEQYFLDAAHLLIDLGRQEEASKILDNISTEPLELDLAAEILLQRAQLHIYKNQNDLALKLLNSKRLNAHPQLTLPQQIEYRRFRSQAYLNNGNNLASTKELIYTDQLLTDKAQEQNHEQIWNTLNLLSPNILIDTAKNEINFEFQGWYELGIIGKAYQYNLDRQLIELELWRQRWTRHPAAKHLPQALQLLETMAQRRPNHIALLLPLNTSAGSVVRDSFMSAYFNVQQLGGKVPSIHFYNTSNTSDIKQLHRQARKDGAEMIIGPLLKQNVALLQQEAYLEVPTLALNSIEGSQSKSALLYQFALSPEEEARQIALKAWQDGHQYASVLSPIDEIGSDFYTRKKNSFIQEWQKLGGQIVAQEVFQDDYTESVESLFNLSDSEYRKEQLSKLIGKTVEFTQRRRQDIDLIFLIAQPDAARQITPRFAYLYAGNIPIYGSQDIYSGLPKPLEDADLNGITFADSPWLLSDVDELKPQTQQLFPQSTALNLRLQAFGIDSFRLYPRLEQLETVPNSQIYGATGILKIDTNRRISRELSWAKIENGEAVLINSTSPPSQ